MLLNVETLDRTPYEAGVQTIFEKVVVVAGAAGGLGGITAIRLAQQGARVFLAARSYEELEAVLSVIRREGGQADGLVIDSQSSLDVQKMFDEASRWGQLYALVNFLSVEKPLFWSDQEMDLCAYDCMQQGMLYLQGVEGAQIINISSGRGSQAGQTIAAGLRRQARQQGICATMVESSGLSGDCAGELVADCVVSSLLQPGGEDVIFPQEVVNIQRM